MPAEVIERRQSPRTGLIQLMRVRSVESGYPADLCTSFNVSRTGIYFGTSSTHYLVGTRLYVTRDFVVADPNREEIIAKVVRVDKLGDGRCGVAIQFLPAV
jgi:hypothetical protein